MRTNLTGPFLMAKHAAAAMGKKTAEGGGGHIVNIASTASKRAWPNATAYHATKWGLLGLSHALHAELRPMGIKVSAIVAGGMRTPFLLDRFPDIDPGVLQDPIEVAKAVKFVLTQPDETVIPELTVLPMRETLVAVIRAAPWRPRTALLRCRACAIRAITSGLRTR